MAEIAAVAEHIASLTAASSAFQVRPDLPDEPGAGAGNPLIPLVEEDRAGDAAEVFAEIREWARASLGVDRVPAVWRALARHQGLLEATWRKDRLVLSAGAVDELTKGCVALAVAQFRQSSYWIAALRLLQHHRPWHAPRGTVCGDNGCRCRSGRAVRGLRPRRPASRDAAVTLRSGPHTRRLAARACLRRRQLVADGGDTPAARVSRDENRGPVAARRAVLLLRGSPVPRAVPTL